MEVSAATVTSGATFEVSATTDEPVITAVLPNVAAAGSQVTVLGSNFETVPVLNNVRLNGSQVVVTHATATALVMLVPPATGSGRIRVITPRGVAVSPSDFIVLPGGYSADQIASSDRAQTDGTPATLAFPAAFKIGVRMFEGARGDLLTVASTARRMKVNAGFNYMPITAGFNSWMNGTTAARIAVELGFAGSVLGVYGAPIVAAAEDCGCN